ncbi:RteC protein [Mucilaginibacter yixingensis]|uniref:RteC protein n=1 Tax=Mucilaginibacter yixingensis TaxID=1295612 RepID=A0A2T5J4D5_9SPHI|nr:RteC domain-containing protein [Mucilaginibacter yixingensis]PTQ92143.1 RteC protein [Mucilaginibacter yixingensis]
MNTQLKNKTTELEQLLTELPFTEPLEYLQNANRQIDECLQYFREQVKQQPFEDSGAEIEFFKFIRPGIVALKIEEIYKYNLIVNKPIGTSASVVHYFEESLKGLQIFFQLNSFYFQYYKNQFSEMDHLYFRRNSGVLSVPVPDTTDIDPDCSTAMSDLFARFIAYEAVQRHISYEVEVLKNGGAPLSDADQKVPELRWTGDVVNIVELAYGIWLTGQLNDGNASLSQIVRWLEKHLQVNIGIAQRKFTEIARRKRLSITRFIDKMRDAILKKMEGDLV